MTTFGIDISHHQDNFDFALAKGQGVQFVFAKATEGKAWQDPLYTIYREQAEKHQLLFSAYHFLRGDSTPEDQAGNAVRTVGKAIPITIDLEKTNGTPQPGFGTARRFAAEVKRLGGRVGLLYFPHFWWEECGRPDLTGWSLFQALYGSNAPGTLTGAYPGNLSERWARMGGVEPHILQFGSLVKVAGQAVDGDAFRGTRAELASTGFFKDYRPKPTPAPAPAPAPKLNRVQRANALVSEAIGLLDDAVEAGRTGKVRDYRDDLKIVYRSRVPK